MNKGASTKRAEPQSQCAWWRCLHCGHDKYEPHIFTGHMKVVPMVKCASCGILHSPPDPDGPRALHYKAAALERFVDAIMDRTPNGEWIKVQYHPNGDWSVARGPEE